MVPVAILCTVDARPTISTLVEIIEPAQCEVTVTTISTSPTSHLRTLHEQDRSTAIVLVVSDGVDPHAWENAYDQVHPQGRDEFYQVPCDVNSPIEAKHALTATFDIIGAAEPFPADETFRPPESSPRRRIEVVAGEVRELKRDVVVASAAVATEPPRSSPLRPAAIHRPSDGTTRRVEVDEEELEATPRRAHEPSGRTFAHEVDDDAAAPGAETAAASGANASTSEDERELDARGETRAAPTPPPASSFPPNLSTRTPPKPERKRRRIGGVVIAAVIAAAGLATFTMLAGDEASDDEPAIASTSKSETTAPDGPQAADAAGAADAEAGPTTHDPGAPDGDTSDGSAEGANGETGQDAGSETGQDADGETGQDAGGETGETGQDAGGETGEAAGGETGGALEDGGVEAGEDPEPQEPEAEAETGGTGAAGDTGGDTGPDAPAEVQDAKLARVEALLASSHLKESPDGLVMTRTSKTTKIWKDARRTCRSVPVAGRRLVFRLPTIDELGELGKAKMLKRKTRYWSDAKISGGRSKVYEYPTARRRLMPRETDDVHYVCVWRRGE